MTLNNRATDRQTHTHTCTLGGVKRFKEFVWIFGIYTYPRILNRQTHTISSSSRSVLISSLAGAISTCVGRTAGVSIGEDGPSQMH